MDSACNAIPVGVKRVLVFSALSMRGPRKRGIRTDGLLDRDKQVYGREKRESGEETKKRQERKTRKVNTRI